MKRFFITVTIILALFPSFVQSQETVSLFRKGQAFFYWGWNRAAYSKSDIHFKGSDFDFVLKDVVAHDRPSWPITLRSYVIEPFIPQNNYKIGYFIKDNLALSFGVDHMKYVMDRNQVVEMTGTISRNGSFKGNYDGPKTLSPDFLTLEHTNGLNYLNIEMEKYYPIHLSKNGKFGFSAYFGGGTGILYPKSDIKLMDYQELDAFHLAGYSLDAKVGLAIVFFNHLLVRLESKSGFINMPDILLHDSGSSDRASQHFIFTEGSGTLGFIWQMKKKKDHVGNAPSKNKAETPI